MNATHPNTRGGKFGVAGDTTPSVRASDGVLKAIVLEGTQLIK